MPRSRRPPRLTRTQTRASSLVQLMPRMRMPLWAAVGIPAAAYGVRGLIRGSLLPDLPGDFIVFGALVVVLLLASRYGSAAQERRDHLSDQVDESDRDERA